MIGRALEEGVDKFYLPAIDNESHQAMLDLETRFPGKCIAMMGLHPTSVKENYKEELAIVADWLKAVHARDVDAVMAHYADDFTGYDLFIPLKVGGGGSGVSPCRYS